MVYEGKIQFKISVGHLGGEPVYEEQKFNISSHDGKMQWLSTPWFVTCDEIFKNEVLPKFT